MPRNFFFLLLIFSFFIHELPAQISPDENKKIKVVAHRGASKFAPENTITAFLKAAEMGADYAEMDVRQTKDGHFIIIHDASIRRTTNGKGLVAEMTLEEIKALDAGAWFGKEFAGENVPTLREVLQAIKGKILPDLDFKAGNPEQFVQLLKEEGYLDEANVTFHGSWSNCKKVKQQTEELLIRPGSKTGAQGLSKLLEELDPPLVNIGRSAFSEYYVSLVQQKGKLAFVNALRRADNKRFMKRAIDANADFIQADKIDVLIGLLKERGLR